MRGMGRLARVSARGLIIVLCVQIAGCGAFGTRESNPQVYGIHDRVPQGGGHYKVGKPYKVAGQWFHPREDPSYDETGTASWYGEYFHGRKTANGEWYDMNRLSAAHPTLPLPVYARVTNLQNRRSVVVRINDRGPFARGRIIDLSRAAADALDMRRAGTAPVRVTYLQNAPLDGDVADMQSLDRRGGGWFDIPFLTSSISGGEAETAQAGPLVPLPSPDTTASLPTADDPSAAAPQGVFVQAASFRDEGRARTLADELAHLGSFAVIPAEIAGDTFYRVRSGPVASLGEAEGLVGSLTAAGIAGGRILGD